MKKRSKLGLAAALAVLGLAAPAQAAAVKPMRAGQQGPAVKYQLKAKWGKAPTGIRWTVLKRLGA